MYTPKIVKEAATKINNGIEVFWKNLDSTDDEDKRDKIIWDLVLVTNEAAPFYAIRHFKNLNITEAGDIQGYWVMAIRNVILYAIRKNYRALQSHHLLSLSGMRVRDVLFSCKYIRSNIESVPIMFQNYYSLSYMSDNLDEGEDSEWANKNLQSRLAYDPTNYYDTACDYEFMDISEDGYGFEHFLEMGEDIKPKIQSQEIKKNKKKALAFKEKFEQEIINKKDEDEDDYDAAI